VIVVGGVWYKGGDKESAVKFRTEPVTRGELVQTISASGTLQAEEVIDVGSQVTGQIASFGTDSDGKPIDYRSKVRKGKILATIDPSVYKSEVDAAQASLNAAKAQVQSANADLVQFKAKLNQAQRDWARAEKLGPSDALAESSYDSYKAGYEVAKANVGIGQATIESAKAGVAAAQASLDKAQRNLDYCVITSPVDGVIIDRRVNIGQTVVSNLNVSSLFLIAKDLKRMEIWASVNEADVGHIHAGQPVTFTVDAYPNRTFKGTVSKLRYNATMTNNVVTYTVEIDVANDDLALIPYMTTNVAFEVARAENALLVPNAAFRFQPSADEVLPGTPEADDQEPAPDQQTESTTTRPMKHAHTGEKKVAAVWVEDGQYVRPIKVKRGITDGVNTVVTSDELKDGDKVVIGQVIATDDAGGTVNPFTPKLPSRKRH
jgi:HlyD family secretion protein